MVSEKTLQTGVSTDQKDTVLVTGQERTDSQIQTFDPPSATSFSIKFVLCNKMRQLEAVCARLCLCEHGRQPTRSGRLPSK